MKYGWVITALVLFLSGCTGCNKKSNRPKPDVSGIQAEVQVMRFDQDLMGFNNDNYDAHSKEMTERYGEFYPFFVSEFIVGPRPKGDTEDVSQKAILSFVSDPYIQQIQDSIHLHYPKTVELDKELSLALRYFKYYFPTIKIPKVVTVNSGFSLSAFTFDEGYLAIGLDMYLGGTNRYYDSVGMYQYLRHKMNRQYITRNSVEALFNLYFGETDLNRSKSLLDAMTEKGKKMYLLSCILPDTPDSVLVGFTAAQIKWCEQNEYEIWKFLNDKDVLYKDDYMDKKRYLDEGPSIPGMPVEAPGNVGSWIGLQIVRKFVKETGGNIPLQELMLKYDPQTVIMKSKYRPAKPIF